MYTPRSTPNACGAVALDAALQDHPSTRRPAAMQTATERRTDARRLLGLVAVFGLLASAAIMASTAQAKIVVGQSIAGVKLGDTEAQVRQLIGKPSECSLCNKTETV